MFYIPYWSWWILSRVMKRCVFQWKSADVSEEYIASVFRVREQSPKETSLKQAVEGSDRLPASRWSLACLIHRLQNGAIYSSEESVDFRRTLQPTPAQRYSPKDGIIHKLFGSTKKWGSYLRLLAFCNGDMNCSSSGKWKLIKLIYFDQILYSCKSINMKWTTKCFVQFLFEKLTVA